MLYGGEVGAGRAWGLYLVGACARNLERYRSLQIDVYQIDIGEHLVSGVRGRYQFYGNNRR